MAVDQHEAEQGALELDKLSVSPAKGIDAEPSETSDVDSEVERSEDKPHGSGRRSLGILGNKGFILSLGAGAVVAGIILYFMFVDKTAFDHENKKGSPHGQITYAVSAPVGFKYHVRFKLLVPFKEKDEKRLLLEKLVGIRPELMGLARVPNVARSLREKDLDALKAEILGIAHRVTNIPLTDLDITGLTVE